MQRTVELPAQRCYECGRFPLCNQCTHLYAHVEGEDDDISEQEDLDILLLDLHMPGNGDLYGLIRIREDYPSLPIAVVSGSEDINVVSKVMGYGAMGFIPKSSSSDEA